MVNQVRTLLLNRGRAGAGFDVPGEEFVPAAYIPKKLPAHLLRVHHALFGREPDRIFLNYRIRQLLLLIHGTELADEVTRDDARLTYLPLGGDTFFDDVFTVDAVQLNHSHLLFVTGEHVAHEALGRCEEVWMLTVLEDNVLRIERERPRRVTTEISYSLTGGLSLPISLPGSGLSVRFRSVPVGTAWHVTSRGRPQTDLAEILPRIETALGDVGVLAVFPPPLAEPMASYFRIWQEHPYLVVRYAALLLGIAKQIEALPQDV